MCVCESKKIAISLSVIPTLWLRTEVRQLCAACSWLEGQVHGIVQRTREVSRCSLAADFGQSTVSPL